MSPRVRRAPAVIALVVLALSILVGAAVAQPPAAPALDARPALPSLAEPLYRELAALKGIAAPGAPPPVLVQTRAEMRRFIEQELDRRYSAARVEAERKAMIAWGLIPSGYDLRRLFLDLMEEQIAAYYDPLRKM